MTAIPRPRVDPARVVAITAVPAAIAVGVLTAISPLLGVVAVVVAGVVWMLASGTRMVPVFHVSLVIILAAYALLNRGIAGLGVPPIYIGEVVLALAAIALIVSIPSARWQPVHLVIVAFMAWGLYRTVPYIKTYEINALRDAVTWGYGLFALAVSLTVRREHVERIVRLYGRYLPWFIVWVPIGAVVYTVFKDELPRLPGSLEPIIGYKAGDTGVQLGAAGAFLLLGLGTASLSAVRDWAVWGFWLLGLGIAAAINRGGMVAASMMTTSIFFARASTRWFSLLLVGTFLVALVGLANPQVDVGLERRLSFQQVVENALSIFDRSNQTLNSTSEWRIKWWTKIVGYTIDGRYFWGGKGFGINLADDDGFQVNADESLRSPHNGHLDILARGGVPMFALWILVQLAFGVTLLRAAMRAKRAGLTYWVRVCGWIFVYWLAALVNASFDVYLEGPMGGIWFWCMMGLGIAVAGIIERELIPAASATGRPDDA